MVFALDAKGVTLPPAPPSNAVPAPPRRGARPGRRQSRRARRSTRRTARSATAPSAVGGVKDLRHLTTETHAEFLDIVLGGKREKLGMPNFGGKLTEARGRTTSTPT